MMTRQDAGGWLSSPAHRRWLEAQEDRLVDFHLRHAFDHEVGFSPLLADGRPDRVAPRELWLTARMVHCFAVESILGRPGAAAVASKGLAAIARYFHDPIHGGWYHSVRDDGTPLDEGKSAYDHAFLVLAGASAAQAGIPGGRDLLNEALSTVDERFWETAAGATVDLCHRDWTLSEPDYRGQNPNMHLVEGYLAAFEAMPSATGLVDRAVAIADRFVNREAREHSWRVPEHFSEHWVVRADYNIDLPADPFRPYGAIVGHAFEWARLILQLKAVAAERMIWADDAAASLVAQAFEDGWGADQGGLVYSVDFDGNPVSDDRMHWAHAEAVGAMVALHQATGDARYEDWYARIWNYVAQFFIDEEQGGWWHELSRDGAPKGDTWGGKPDLYHALQATLFARYPVGCGLAAAANRGLVA